MPGFAFMLCVVGLCALCLLRTGRVALDTYSKYSYIYIYIYVLCFAEFSESHRARARETLAASSRVAWRRETLTSSCAAAVQ